MRERLLQVVRRQPVVERDRRVERLEEGVLGVAEAAHRVRQSLKAAAESPTRSHRIRGDARAGHRSHRQGRARGGARSGRARRRGACARARSGRAPASLLPPGVDARARRRDRAAPRSGPRRRAASSSSTPWACPSSGSPDAGIFDRVNARGTETVVRAAAARGRGAWCTRSTIDVFHAERGGAFDESHVADYPKGTAYERSKQRAEQLALAAAAEAGIELVIVNPAGVYGPGPRRRRAPRSGGAAAAADRGHGAARALAAARRHGPGLLHRPRAPATCWRPSAASRRALHPLRRPHELSRAGRHRGPTGRPRQGAAGDAGAARQGDSPPPARRVVARDRAGRRSCRAASCTSSSGTPGPQSGRAQRELGWVPTPLEEGLRAAVAALA